MAPFTAPQDRNLLAECRTLGGCETGSAKITRGYRLKARHVIHAVGPVWGGGDKDEEGLLAGCYRTALDLAAANRLRTIAYPAISTGIYRFPADLAARIAVGTVASEIAARPRGMARVDLLLFRTRQRGASQGRVCRIGTGVTLLVRPSGPHPALRSSSRAPLSWPGRASAPPDRGQAQCDGASSRASSASCSPRACHRRCR